MAEGTVSIVRQGASFLAIGCGLIVADWLVFVMLTALHVAPVAANLAGRVTGAALSFWANGRITFGQDGAPRLGHRRFARFAVLWCVLTAVSTVLVAACADFLGLRLAWLAKPLVEGVLAAVSFLVSRHWVYR